MMDGFWLPMMPFAFFFGWLMARQQLGTACPHCGGALGGHAGVAFKSKAADDELALGGQGTGLRAAMVGPLVTTVALIGAILVFSILLMRPTPLVPLRAAPPVPPVLRPLG